MVLGFQARYSPSFLGDCLLGARVVGVAAFPAAAECTRVQACVALAADHFVTVVLLGKLTKA